jgi:hypothetical protein
MPIMRNPFRKQDENVRPVTEENVTPYETKVIDVDSKSTVEYQLSGESHRKHPLVSMSLERWADPDPSH